MQVPLQVQFHGVDPSPALEERVRERADRLERFGGVNSCHVTVEAPHKHRRKGGLYSVRIQLRVNGDELAINRAGARDHAHEDVYVALRDAFDAAERRLEDFVRRRDPRDLGGTRD